MKYNKINIFLPTYHRVSNGKLPRFLTSCIVNVSRMDNVCITFLLNKNDYETIDYLNNVRVPLESEMLFTNMSKPHLGKFYNYIYNNTRFKDAGTLVSMVGDDMEWRTAGYDKKILNAINRVNGYGLVYCNDDFVQGDKLCVNLFTTRKFVELTGKPFMCEMFAAYYIDTVWMEVGEKTNTLIYLDDVILKHHHYTANPKRADKTSIRLKKEMVGFKKGHSLVNKYVNTVIKNINSKGVLHA